MTAAVFCNDRRSVPARTASRFRSVFHFASSRARAGNKGCESAFIAEETPNTGAGDEALAVLVGNLCPPTCHRLACRSSKLSLVCNIRRLRRRRYELWLHDISTMHGHREGNGQLMPTEYAVRSSAWTSFSQASAKSLFSLSAIRCAKRPPKAASNLSPLC